MTPSVQSLIQTALNEDIGSGDITTDNLIPPDLEGSGTIIAKEPMILAGIDVARQVFHELDPAVVFVPLVTDGTTLEAWQTIANLQGGLASLLKAERTALNFLQRLSGIATHVRSYVRLAGNAATQIVDTRKTTPGWRVLEKSAVRVGGARNHRMGLYDGVLIKDNHIAAFGGIKPAIEHIRKHVSHLIKIEVEVTDMDEVKEAVDAGAEIIMLDNMDVEQARAAITFINNRAVVEISGGIQKKNLQEMIDTGVDIISIGALTHGARSVDISMKIKQKTRVRREA
jgi:nicotinate-nucleotide pyrophosphorylase (carboxylating)